MKRPRDYKLEQCPTSGGEMQANLHLSSVEDEGDKDIYIDTHHDIHLRPKSARALAKRLLAMADWVEE